MPFLQTIKPKIKVEIINPFSRLACAFGEVVGVLGMSFHGNPIALMHVTIVVTLIKKGATKLPFPSLITSKVKDMAIGIVLWWESDIVVCK